MNRLSEKVAVVTGGARGNGRAIATLFAAEGAKVVVADVNEPEPAYGEETVVFHRADVSESSEVKALVDFTFGRFGRLDTLVNNAGIEIEGGKNVVTLSEEIWDRVINVNLRSMFLCSKHAIPKMCENGGGAIINLGSIAGFLADPGMPAYNASKAGVHMLTRSIAFDHGVEGIRCNAICPGWIMTDMTSQLFDHVADRAEEERRVAAQHPVGRFGRPEDIAKMALWLASDEGEFASGQFFTIDGGLTAASPVAL